MKKTAVNVSYTHLDVYKRQAQSTVELLKQKENVELVLNEAVTEIYGEKKPTGITVSYTHLDVYKRQAHS